MRGKVSQKGGSSIDHCINAFFVQVVEVPESQGHLQVHGGTCFFHKINFVIIHERIKSIGSLVIGTQIHTQFLCEHISGIDPGMQIGVTEQSPLLHGPCTHCGIGDMEKPPQDPKFPSCVKLPFPFHRFSYVQGVFDPGTDPVVSVLPQIAHGDMK